MRRMLASLLALSLLGLAACTTAPKPPPGQDAAAPTSVQTVTATVKSITTTPQNVTAVAFADAAHGFLADGSAIHFSADGGNTWTRLSDAGAPVGTLDFVSATLGWAGTDAGLLATADGGKSWAKVAVGGTFKRVDFGDATHGWALDDKLNLLASTDGGKSWVQRANPCGQEAATSAFSFVDAASGWMLCGGQPGAGQQGKWLFRTLDGGRTWTNLTSTPSEGAPPGQPGGLPAGGYVADLFFLDAAHGWFSLNRGGLWSTADGGSTWTQARGLSGADSLPAVRFVSPEKGFMIQEQGTRGLLATLDGGATWVPLYPGLRPNTNLPQRAFDMQNWLAVGDRVENGAILKTTDAGTTWSRVGSLGSDPVFDVSFPDPQHGWAVTDHWNGTATSRVLSRTTDGGATWTQVAQSPDDPKEYYNSVWFIDDKVGWVASRNRLSITTNGGATFQNVDETPDSGYQFQFADKTHGWKIKDFRLFATADGGKTWTPVNLESRVLTYRLLPGGAAWVIGGELVNGSRKPVLFSTADGGKSWTRYDLGAVAMGGIQFVNATHGLLAGEDDHLYATEDGGRTWTQLK